MNPNISGVIRVMPFPCVYDMVIEQEAYIHADEIFITKHAIFIHLNTPIFTFQFYESQKDVEDFALIRRVGSGLTEKDFCLDFTIVSPEYIFDHENNIGHNELIMQKGNYIVFSDPDVEIVVEEDFLPLEKVEDITQLEEMLEKALASDEFEKAAVIRDRIALIKKNK